MNRTKKILCIHAHESNIYYINKMFKSLPCTIEHKIVSLTNKTIDNKVMLREEMAVFFDHDTVAYILTCTEHCSIVREEKFCGIPILKIEDPIIEKFSNDPEEKVLLFTNPNTVSMTVNKIKKIDHHFKNYDVKTIPDSFDLIMKNEKALYRDSILNYIKKQTKKIYLMQLSMSIIQEDNLSKEIKINNVYGEAKRKYLKVISDLLKND